MARVPVGPRRPAAATARRPEPSRASRPARSPTPREQPVPRQHPKRPARASPPRMRLTAGAAGCRRCPRRQRPDPGRPPRTADPNHGPRARPALPHGSRARRGRPSPPRTSEAPGPVRPAPPPHAPARRALPAPPAHSAREREQEPRVAKAPRALRVPPAPGRPRRGPRDQAHPGRARPGRPSRVVRVPAGRVPARGQVTTHSARPRPVWARLLRPGPRLPCPASRVVPSRAKAPAAQGARVVPVPAGAVQAPRAARVVPGRAGSPARAPVVPGRAP